MHRQIFTEATTQPTRGDHLSHDQTVRQNPHTSCSQQVLWSKVAGSVPSMLSGDRQRRPKHIQEVDHFLFSPDYILTNGCLSKTSLVIELSMASWLVCILLLAKWHCHYPFISIWFFVSELPPSNTHCSVLSLWSNLLFPFTQVPGQITPITAAGPWGHRITMSYSHLGSQFHASFARKYTRNRGFIALILMQAELCPLFIGASLTSQNFRKWLDLKTGSLKNN